jgi:DinB superfamily
MTSAEMLQSLLVEIVSIEDAVKNEFTLLPESRLNWKENPSSWSILECIEHLNLYCCYYNHQLRKSIARAKGKNYPVEKPKSTWLGRKFIDMMHPDNIKKQKTLKRMNPANSALDVSVLEKFLQYQRELHLIIGDAQSVNLNKSHVPVEFMKLLRMNLGDALTFVIVHERRHIAQAKNVLIRNVPVGKASLII